MKLQVCAHHCLIVSFCSFITKFQVQSQVGIAIPVQFKNRDSLCSKEFLLGSHLRICSEYENLFNENFYTGNAEKSPFGISERRPKCLCHRVVVATQADEPPIEPPSSRDLWHEPRQSSQSQRSAELYSDSPGLCQKSDGNGEGTCPCHSTRSCPPGLAPRSCVLCQRATPPQGETLHEKPAVPLCT